MNHRNPLTPLSHPFRRRRPAARQRGIAAILAMMFLVIFGSLAAAMAIVSQGNLRTAESHLKINRTLAAAESGMALMQYRLDQVLVADGPDADTRPDITTTEGLISADVAFPLWNTISTELHTLFDADIHQLAAPTLTAFTNASGNVVNELTVGPIRVGPGEPDFMATFTPHPIPGEDYDDPLYDEPPYDGSQPETGITWDVSAAAPLDERFVRIRVTAYDDGGGGDREVSATDGTNQSTGAQGDVAHSRVYRSVQMDYLITKRIPFAILSRSRIMVGRNVLIDGPIGSHFTEVGLTNGHPVQVLSDFRGLDSNLDTALDDFYDVVAYDDINGDNRLNIASSTETAGIVGDPALLDLDGDGYISDFDFFLDAFDSDGDGRVSRIEIGYTTDPTREQLFDLINAMSPNQYGDNPDYIDAADFYAKIRGEVSILATKSDWEAGAAGGAYQDYLQGPILPDYGESPVTFDDTADADLYAFEAADFNIASFANTATTTVADQAVAPVQNDIGQPAEYEAPSASTREAVPFGSDYPYDYYDRPVYRNMVFVNAKIPKGTNALFENCRFIGVTYVETEPVNTDTNYNYAGMQNSDGSFKHPDKVVTIGGADYGGDPNAVGPTQALGTKLVSNNVRFHNCTFEGAIVSGDWSGGTTSNQPGEFTHTRNKVAFTGNTNFNIENSTSLSDAEKQLYERSTLLLPHFSVEMGSFQDGYSSSETVELSGMIVAGLIDMRGQVDINGTVVTTFEPQSNTGPVIGNTSPQFNTTLGYFDNAAGDLEGSLPTTGLGKITLRYDPTMALPDDIDGPISVVSIPETFREGGQ